MITVQEADLFDSKIASDIKSIIIPHHKEVEDGEWKLDPDYDRILDMYDRGEVRAFVVYDEDTLAGYCIDLVVSSLHYKGKIVAVSDSIYINPDYRHYGIAEKLLQFAQDTYKEDGIAAHSVTLKTGNPCKMLMSNLGYENQETIWFKRLQGIA